MADLATEHDPQTPVQDDGQGNGADTGSRPAKRARAPDDDDDDEDGKPGRERRKIDIKFISDKSRRHITFSKRKAGIMKKAYELSVLTGTQVLLLVVSETGLVYTFTTPKLQPLVTKPEGKNLIQHCLNAPSPTGANENGLEEGNAGGDVTEDQNHAQMAQPAGMARANPMAPGAASYMDPNMAYQNYLQQQQQAQVQGAQYPMPPQPRMQQHGGHQ